MKAVNIIYLVLFYIITANQLDGAKVAAGISVSSSSCYDNSLTCASRAVDGNFSQFNYFKSKEEAGQWLRLNLSQVYHIFRVQVTSHQLSHFEDIEVHFLESDISANHSSVYHLQRHGSIESNFYIAFNSNASAQVPQAKYLILNTTNPRGLFINEIEILGYKFDPQALHVLLNDSPRSRRPSLSNPSWREIPSNLQSTLELSTLQVKYSLWRLGRLLPAQHVAVFSSSNNGIAFAEFSVFAISMK
ncbi:hypothetical protein EB796_022955 [Bugula neritina]|uniref:F5/8 type C domain-containing protein n=1 Tax=Bugula neritina TaxID=10212 RepID=A0A7J7IYU1_BUGNE|nr:hypothetical protein EB796_022955 [Bugula neritina]